ELAILTVFLDERGAHPSRDVPVDAADVVTLLVFAHFLEFQPRAAEHAAVGPEEHLVGEDPGAHLEVVDLAQRIRRPCGRGGCLALAPAPGEHPPPRVRRLRRGPGSRPTPGSPLRPQLRT